MSKSKRAAQGAPTPAPRQRRHIFTGADGGPRTGWLLAISLLCYAAVALGARLVLGRAFTGLFTAWGIDAANVHHAPRWAQLVYAWHGTVITAVVSLLTLALCRCLRRLWRLEGERARFDGRALLASAGAGIAVVLLSAALSLIPDSSRLAWPLSAPHLTWSLPVLCAISLLAALAGETFGKAVLYDGIRARWGGMWATAIAGVFFLLTGGTMWTGVGIVNGLLLGVLTCLAYRRRGLWAATGLRWGWSMANTFLLGFGGGDASVYRLYGVSEVLMTGGDAGPVNGLWTALLLAGIVALLFINQKQAN